MVTDRNRVSPIVKLVSTALSQNRQSGLSSVMEKITLSLDAVGSILWQVAPKIERNQDSSNDYLFMLAQWFAQDPHCMLHYLPLNRSVAGTAALGQESINVKNIREDNRVYQDHPFLREAGINVMCSVPVVFRNDVRGALNFYRTEPTPFTEQEVAQAEEISLIVPALYQIVSQEDNLGLMAQVDKTLDEAEALLPAELFHSEGEGGNLFISKDEVKKVLQQVCEHVSNELNCLETSIFMEDGIEAPGIYDMMASTWPGHLARRSYTGIVDEGLTGWVLHYGQPVKLFNLARFEFNKQAIHRVYPGLIWKYLPKMIEIARKYLELDPADELPPLSFIAAPIIRNNKVRGAIRSSVPKKGSYHFTDRQLKVLRLVGDQVGRFWSNWVSRREVQEENESWRKLVASVGNLNDFVHDDLQRIVAGKPSRLFAKALRETSSLIPEGEISDIRLLDDTQKLKFVETQGDAWSVGDHQQIERRKNKTFPITGQHPGSAGAYVMQTGEVYEIPDVHDKRYYYSETFPDTKRLIVAPISVKTKPGKDDKPFGVLDIRGIGERPFPPYAKDLARMLGHQLGLYHFLMNNTRVLAERTRALSDLQSDLKARVTELERLKKDQIQAFEDLGHQLKTPLNQVYQRSQLALKECANDMARANLQAIRGLCAKAKRVARSTGLTAEFSRGESIGIKASRLHFEDTVKMLIEAALDAKLTIDPDRNIKFNVEKTTFEILTSIEIEADFDLLEQAVSNILDNAGKYSYRNTTVTIRGGLSGTNRFYIAVANRGLPIRSNEVRLYKERGWRATEALLAADEGSGIGLWIVDHIANAHKGDLLIDTTAEGLTEVRLIFG